MDGGRWWVDSSGGSCRKEKRMDRTEISGRVYIAYLSSRHERVIQKKFLRCSVEIT